MISLLWSSLLAFLMVPSLRRVVAMTLVIALAVMVVAPPARAQIGIPAVIAAATAVVSLINNDDRRPAQRDPGHDRLHQQRSDGVQSFGRAWCTRSG